MRELKPGLWHWTAMHERIGMDVSSCLLVAERVALDPMVPPEGLDALADLGGVEHVVLTNRHHLRHAARLVERFGCTVHASRPGMHEFGPDDPPVEPFDFGDELPGGLVAHEVGALCPDETAIHVPRHAALAVADGAIHYGGEVAFVPDHLMGDDPEGVKAGLRAAYRRLAAELRFDTLLTAHGEPIVGGGREALARLAGEAGA